jgi:hypothetical protein
MPSEPSGEIRTPTENQLEVGTWGVFFVWTGIALLADLGWGVWLLGVGAIILGGQVVRRLLTLTRRRGGGRQRRLGLDA